MAFNNNLNEKSTGFQSLASSGTVTGRSLAFTSNQTSITNTDGTGGNPVVSLTSTIYVNGISFNGGSNTFSNYATGTFIPAIDNGTNPPTVTYSVQIGRYTRVGNAVYIGVTVTAATYSAGLGGVGVSSLPFTSSSVSQSIWPVQIQNCTFGAGAYYVVLIGTSNTRMVLSGPRSGMPASNIAAASPTNTTNVVTSGIYLI